VKRPDISLFEPHLTVDDADLDGVTVPGLRAEFLRRPDGARVATVGRYSHAGRELFMAWGYVGEEHCRYYAVRGVDGDWERPQAGCPRVRVLRDGADTVAGLAMRSASGDWLFAGFTC
jgi:hypothetical protein